MADYICTVDGTQQSEGDEVEVAKGFMDFLKNGPVSFVEVENMDTGRIVIVDLENEKVDRVKESGRLNKEYEVYPVPVLVEAQTIEDAADMYDEEAGFRGNNLIEVKDVASGRRVVVDTEVHAIKYEVEEEDAEVK